MVWKLVFMIAALSMGLVGCGAPEAVVTQAHSEQYQVRLAIDAAALGRRVAQIEVRDRAGAPVEAEAVIVAPSMADMGHAAPELVAERQGDGSYRAVGELFSMRGEWLLSVVVRRGGSSETLQFPITVRS
jgi:hypothetical protein